MFGLSFAQRQMVVAAFGFSTVNALVKFLEAIPTFQVTFVRSALMLIFTWAALGHRKIPARGNRPKVLIARGIAGTLSLTLFFWTLTELPLATAQIIQYSSPLFTVLLAVLFFGERAGWRVWWALVLCLVGILFIKGWEANIKPLAVLAGVASAALSGLAYNLIRKTGKSDDPLVVVFYFSLVASVTLVGPALSVWVWPSFGQWGILFAIGCLTQFSQLALTKAYHHGRASEVSHFINFGAILAAGFGYFFFQEVLGIWALLGILFILGGVALSRPKA